MADEFVSLPGEIWKPVVGFPGYLVSNLGRVYSLPRVRASNRRDKAPHDRRYTGRMMKPRISQDGYGHLSLCRPGEKRVRTVHSLVLETFVGPRPAGMFGCHNDGNGSNNRLDNLRYDTPRGNSHDRYSHGTVPIGESHGKAKLTADLVREIRRTPHTTNAEWGRRLGLDKTTIRRARIGETWPHVGTAS